MAIPDATLLSFESEPSSDHYEDQQINLAILLNKYKDKFTILPTAKGWMGEKLYMYKGFWYRSQNPFSIETTMAMQDTLRVHSTDIYLVTQLKSSTTWIKALMFATVNRAKYKTNNLSTHPLLNCHPHNCVPFIELEFINKTPNYVYENPPRLFSTHIPYNSIPKSIFDDGCRLIYLCGNPKDVFVSWYYFSPMMTDKSYSHMTIDEMFEVFSRGMIPYGPYWDHVKQYYEASCKYPTRILFLTYETIKMDTTNQVKRIAEFLGYPFMKEEEEKGAVEEIVRLCSFENLKEVHKHGYWNDIVPSAAFFREGKVGGWKNDLTSKMSKILDDVTKEKFEGLDLSF